MKNNALPLLPVRDDQSTDLFIVTVGPQMCAAQRFDDLIVKYRLHHELIQLFQNQDRKGRISRRFASYGELARVVLKHARRRVFKVGERPTVALVAAVRDILDFYLDPRLDTARRQDVLWNAGAAAMRILPLAA